MLTVDQVVQVMPANLKSVVTPQLVNNINNVVNDPIVAEQIRNNFMSYTRVLQEGKFKTEDYLSAIMYVSYKLMGNSNQDAYCLTFPQRHATLVANGASAKDISSYVSAYAKGKLVNLILEQTLIPSWVLNQEIYQRAINKQADLMMNASSEFVQQQAANSLLTHLTKPKEAGPLVNINLNESSGMNELKDLLMRTAQKQQEAIKSGVSTKDIAGETLIEGTAKDVTP